MLRPFRDRPVRRAARRTVGEQGARACALFLALSLVLAAEMPGARPAPSVAATGDVPGSDAVFAGRGVAIVWGMLRGVDGGDSSVVIWIASQDPAIRAVSVNLLDAAGSRIEILPPSLIGKAREARAPRARFNTYPRAELRFAAAPDRLVSGESAVTVSFAGIPETTPEFASEEALAEHLQSALARATGQ